MEEKPVIRVDSRGGKVIEGISKIITNGFSAGFSGIRSGTRHITLYNGGQDLRPEIDIYPYESVIAIYRSGQISFARQLAHILETNGQEYTLQIEEGRPSL